MISDQTFIVSTVIGSNDYEFTISPEWDENRQEHYFVATLENTAVGKLRKAGFDYWHWELGSTKLNSSVAYCIGKQIDLHYKEVLTA